MSQEYDNYLTEHFTNVKNGIEWLRKHDILPEFVNGPEWAQHSIGIADGHDLSKYSVEEYEAYDDYFYGDFDEEDRGAVKDAFDYAWLHHIHNNPHHWQYWLLVEDDGGMKAMEMPERYVYEMIADWWSFSWKADNLYEIFDWYEKHKPKMNLHPKTLKMVEGILKRMRDILDREKEDQPDAESHDTDPGD